VRASLVALKLALGGLEIEPAITTRRDRTVAQRGVYLAQKAGLSLGYGFGWYGKGPFCPRLLEDLIATDEEVYAGLGGDERRLARPAAEVLVRLLPLTVPPAGMALDRLGWLDLLGTLAYLHDDAHLDTQAARTRLGQDKPELAVFADFAFEALGQLELLGV